MRDPTSARLRVLGDVVETVHAVLYFAAEVQERWVALGLEPRTAGYVVGRAAPLGRVGPTLAAATFFNYNPDVFRRLLPGAWDVVDPATALAERARGVQAVFERVDAPTADLVELTGLASRAAAVADTAGRPLAAANAAVPLPAQPFARLWQLLAVLREHRGDGHVALLVAAGLGRVEALVLMAAWQDRISRRFLQRSRQWRDDDWAAATERLAGRGLVTDGGDLTDAGQRLRDRLETDTDRLAVGPYRALGDDGVERLFDLLRPVAVAVAEGGVYPRPPDVPTGLPDDDGDER